MAVQKKSLISNRVTVKKALIASQPETEQENPLKASALTAQSMKKKRLNTASVLTLRAPKAFESFKAAKKL
jgi:hypothetical protein